MLDNDNEQPGQNPTEEKPVVITPQAAQEAGILATEQDTPDSTLQAPTKLSQVSETLSPEINEITE